MSTMHSPEATAETIEIVATPEQSRRIADARASGKHPILVHNGIRYRLDPAESQTAAPAERDIWAGYDPQKVHDALDAAAGSWSDVDAEKLIADIYRWRDEGTRPSNRP